VCVRVWVCRLNQVHVYLIDRPGARRPRHFLLLLLFMLVQTRVGCGTNTDGEILVIRMRG
jgi:hypothetical protein